MIVVLLACLTVVEYWISIREGYAMFEAKPFIGIARAVRRLFESMGAAAAPITAMSILMMFVISASVSTKVYARRDI